MTTDGNIYWIFFVKPTGCWRAWSLALLSPFPLQCPQLPARSLAAPLLASSSSLSEKIPIDPLCSAQQNKEEKTTTWNWRRASVGRPLTTLHVWGLPIFPCIYLVDFGHPLSTEFGLLSLSELPNQWLKHDSCRLSGSWFPPSAHLGVVQTLRAASFFCSICQGFPREQTQPSVTHHVLASFSPQVNVHCWCVVLHCSGDAMNVSFSEQTVLSSHVNKYFPDKRTEGNCG